MGNKLSLVLCCAAVAALNLAQPAYAQTAQQSRSHAAASHHRAAQPNDANAYGQSPFMNGSNGHEPGQCFIPVDGDHDLGYWGDCSTKRARQVK
jgi:hypothetical protein